MMVERSNFPRESSPTNLIENILDILELEGSQLTIVPLEFGKEAGISADVVEKVLRDRGLEAEDREVMDVDSGDVKVPHVENEEKKKYERP